MSADLIQERQDAGDVPLVRSIAAGDLLYTIQTIDPHYIAGAMHRFLAGKLQDVAAGRIKRLIINTPPRHGKSRLTAVEFPAWLLARKPRHHVMVASYSGYLSMKHSRECLARMRSAPFKFLFPKALVGLKQSADDWMTAEGGGYVSTSVGGSATGLGADLLIIDDPHKDFEESNSPTIREKIWNWFLSTAYTRLSPDGAIVVIMTRWHEDDLVGRLLDPKREAEIVEAGGSQSEKWEVINLPAMAEEQDPLCRSLGAPLFPERFPMEKLRAIRATVGSFLWSALYRGHPIPKGGHYLDSACFGIIPRDQLPAKIKWVRFWDLATSEDDTADFTASVKLGIGHPPGRPDLKADCYYIADVVNRQMKWSDAKRKVVDLASIEKILVGIEAQGGFRIAFQELKPVLNALGVVCHEYGVDADKLTRALPWIVKAEEGKIFLVADEWVMAFKNQVEAFPHGKNDDMVDAVSGAFEMLQKPVLAPMAASPMNKVVRANAMRRVRHMVG